MNVIKDALSVLIYQALSILICGLVIMVSWNFGMQKIFESVHKLNYYESTYLAFFIILVKESVSLFGLSEGTKKDVKTIDIEI